MFRQCVKDKVMDSRAANQQIIPSGGEEEEEEDKEYGGLLEGFSKKERKRILKKLSRMDGHEVGGGGDTERHKLDKHKKKSKKRSRVRLVIQRVVGEGKGDEVQ